MRAVLLLLFCAGAAFARVPLNEDRLKELASSDAWLKILHYKPKWITHTLRGLNDSKAFYFSPTGQTDSLSELKATIEGLYDTTKEHGHLKQPAQCAFPYRYKFLKKHLKIDPPKVKCPKFDEFVNKFKAQSVSMVFSSATPNNPASMFGHTFMKINSTNNSELLDWGINFAATVSPDENPFAFIVFGLFGGYVGQFSMMPYFQKVNEYTNSESRDLWEYELNMSQEEIDDLLAHLWELETNGYFAYFFFDENCSYQLLAAIEAVKPQWNLTDFPIYAIPGETIKKLTDSENAIRKVKFRPSLQKQMLWAYRRLSPDEKDKFFEVSNSRRGVESIQSPRLLDALAINYLYTRHNKGGKPPADELSYQAKLLQRRSEFPPGDMVNVDEIPSETRPDLGHDSYRLGAWMGISQRPVLDKSQGFLELSWKSAYHDLLNKDLGFSRLSHIDFPGIDVRYNFNDHTLTIEKITGIETTSIFPLSLVEKRLSWKFSGYSYNPKDFGCDYCHVMHVDGGAGGALEVFTPKLVAFGMLLIQGEFGDSFGKGYRYGPGLWGGLIHNMTDDVKLMLSSYHWWDSDQSQRLDKYFTVNFDASYSLSRNWEMRAGVQKLFHYETNKSDYGQIQLKINKYFN